MACWNLARFAETLLPLMNGGEEEKVEAAENVLTSFEPQFREAYYRGFADKFGLRTVDDTTGPWIRSTLLLLEKEEVDFTRFFSALNDMARGDDRNLRTEFGATAI